MYILVMPDITNNIFHYKLWPSGALVHVTYLINLKQNHFY